MSITAMRQARAKIMSAQTCHLNATRTLLDEADELLCVAIQEAEQQYPVGEVIREGVIRLAKSYPVVGSKLYAAGAQTIRAGYLLVPVEVFNLYEFMNVAFTPIGEKQQDMQTKLNDARKAMLAAAKGQP